MEKKEILLRKKIAEAKKRIESLSGELKKKPKAGRWGAPAIRCEDDSDPGLRELLSSPTGKKYGELGP